MYAQDNYNKVRELIDNRRNNARTESLARSAELRLLSEELTALDKELSGTGLLIFKTACEGGDIAPLRERNVMLNKRRREIIVSLGYPEDYTDVKYTCEKCQDTGFVECRMCSCFKELLLTENIKSSGMGRLIEEQSFENFDIEFYRDEPELYSKIKANIERAKTYAEGFGTSERGKNLLLIGSTGSGKTHISTSIAKRVISRGYSVLYDSAQNIVTAFENDKFRSGYSRQENVSDKYLECDLLILDDLGTEFVNQFTIGCLYNLLNTRSNRGLSTIVSTNLSAGELVSRYDDRIYSRIIGSDYTVLSFGGKNKDYRLFGKKKK